MQRDSRLDRTQEPLYTTEHYLAWFMGAVAVVLGIIGILVGFGILDFRSADTVVDINGVTGTGGLFGSNFWDGTMWLFSGITAAIATLCLHASGHHREPVEDLPDSEKGLMGAEHVLAYAFVVAAIVLVVVGLLAGYAVFGNDNGQFDGLMWIWLGFGSSILGAAFHLVQHHEVAVQDEHIIRILEERMRPGAVPPTASPRTETGRTLR